MLFVCNANKKEAVEFEVETSVTIPSGVEVSVLGEVIVFMEGEDFTNLHFENGNAAEIQVAKEILAIEVREIYDEEEYWCLNSKDEEMEFVHATLIDYPLY